MDKFKLEPTTVIWSLALLDKSLAEAIEWASQQKGKIELEVPELENNISARPQGPVSAGCSRCQTLISPQEIYVAVRKAMSRKHKLGRKTKRHPKPHK